MTIRVLLSLVAYVAVMSAQTNAGGRPVHNEAERLAKWKAVEMPLPSALSERERQMIAKLVEASRLLDEIYWRQSDTGGLALYRGTRSPVVKNLFAIMGGRWDLLDENRPFLGEAPMPRGRDLYPHDLTRPAIDAYIAAHPEDRAAIYSPYTVVKRRDDRLIGVPYQQEYKDLLAPAAKALRDAASLGADTALADFLRLRADALLSGDYQASDRAWAALREPKFDIIFGPYGAGLDTILGTKTAYGAAVLIRNQEESRKLAELAGRAIPDTSVMDAVYRAGSLRYGSQPSNATIAGRQIFFKDLIDARFEHVVLPLARKLLQPQQAAAVSADGYRACVYGMARASSPAPADPSACSVAALTTLRTGRAQETAGIPFDIQQVFSLPEGGK